GLRPGENEIVVKAVTQKNGMVTFNLTAEGDDVVTHEVATALRLEALERSKPAAPKPAAERPKVEPKPDEAKPATQPEEPKKVSLVGEKSAPLKEAEEENKLTAAERRRKMLREYYRSNIDPVGRVLAEELAKLRSEEKLVKAQMPQTLVMEEL